VDTPWVDELYEVTEDIVRQLKWIEYIKAEEDATEDDAKGGDIRATITERAMSFDEKTGDDFVATMLDVAGTALDSALDRVFDYAEDDDLLNAFDMVVLGYVLEDTKFASAVVEDNPDYELRVYLNWYQQTLKEVRENQEAALTAFEAEFERGPEGTAPAPAPADVPAPAPAPAPASTDVPAPAAPAPAPAPASRPPPIDTTRPSRPTLGVPSPKSASKGSDGDTTASEAEGDTSQSLTEDEQTQADAIFMKLLLAKNLQSPPGTVSSTSGTPQVATLSRTVSLAEQPAGTPPRPVSIRAPRTVKGLRDVSAQYKIQGVNTQELDEFIATLGSRGGGFGPKPNWF
jgi:hypothetical protein